MQSLTLEEAQRDVKQMLGPFGKVAPIAKGNKLLVTDIVGNLRRVKKLLDENEGQGSSTPNDFEVISLGGADGNSILKTLQGNYGYTGTGPKPANAPYIELDGSRNAIIIRGNTQQIQDVRGAIRKLAPGAGGPVGAGGGDAARPGLDRIRMITLDRGDPTEVIEAITNLWNNLRQNPIEVVTQSQLLPRLDALKGRTIPALHRRLPRIPRTNPSSR